MDERKVLILCSELIGDVRRDLLEPSSNTFELLYKSNLISIA